MKIVRIIARLNVGGPARHVVWLTAGLRPPRYSTLLVAGTVPPGEDDMSYFATEHGVTPYIIPEMSREISLKDGLTIWKLYRLLRRERPDVVHTHTAKAGTVGRISGFCYRWLTLSTLLGRPRPCRFVHTYHGHIFHSYYGPLKTRLFLAIEKALARLVTDRIIVISRQQYREIHEQFKVGRSEQFSIIPLGLDLGAFSGWRERRDVLRRELGAKETDVLVGIVGRLTEVKNHSLFLRAVARYKELHGLETKEGGRVRFLIIGDGHLRDGLEREARDLGLTGELTFLGTRKDPENFYPALDSVALTSLNEGTPLTLIEAMANSRAVVATAVGGVVDLLGEPSSGSKEAVGPKLDEGLAHREREGKGETTSQAALLCERGVRVVPNDAEAFCEGLKLLISDARLRQELGERGRRFVEAEYTKDRLLADVMKLYDGLAQSSEQQEGAWGLEPGEEISAGSKLQPQSPESSQRLKGA